MSAVCSKRKLWNTNTKRYMITPMGYVLRFSLHQAKATTDGTWKSSKKDPDSILSIVRFYKQMKGTFIRLAVSIDAF